MQALWNRIKTEPVMVVGLLNAGLVLAAAFGASVTAEQSDALKGFAGAILLLAFGARQMVTPNSKVQP